MKKIRGQNDARHETLSGVYHVSVDQTGGWELWDADFVSQPGPRGLPLAGIAGSSPMGGISALHDCRGIVFLAPSLKDAIEHAKRIAALRHGHPDGQAFQEAVVEAKLGKLFRREWPGMAANLRKYVLEEASR